MAKLNYTVTFRLTNKRAVRALATAAQYIHEQADGREWDAEAQRASRAVAYAIKHLKPVAEVEE